MIILGGGLIKHHICNANLMRNGADFSLFVNTASEFDGSDSGARQEFSFLTWHLCNRYSFQKTIVIFAAQARRGNILGKNQKGCDSGENLR